MKERYFITGATGFVGSNLVRALIKNGNHVAVLVRNKKKKLLLSDIRNYLTVYEGNVTDTNFSSLFVKEKPSVVFHLSTYGAMPEESNFSDMIDINIKGLRHMLTAAQDSSIRLFVNTGSSSEYGIKEKKMQEEDCIHPINEYGVTKAAATLLCQKASRNSTFSVMTFRLFSPYGYYEQGARFIPSVIQSALKGQPFHASSPTFVRDFIFIDDVIRAYQSVTRRKSSSLNGHIINIGSGKEHSLGDAVSIIGKIMKKGLDVRWNTKSKQQRQIEPEIWEADIQKAKHLLKWTPKNSFESGLRKTIAWMKKIDSNT